MLGEGNDTEGRRIRMKSIAILQMWTKHTKIWKSIGMIKLIN